MILFAALICRIFLLAWSCKVLAATVHQYGFFLLLILKCYGTNLVHNSVTSVMRMARTARHCEWGLRRIRKRCAGRKNFGETQNWFLHISYLLTACGSVFFFLYRWTSLWNIRLPNNLLSSSVEYYEWGPIQAMEWWFQTLQDYSFHGMRLSTELQKTSPFSTRETEGFSRGIVICQHNSF